MGILFSVLGTTPFFCQNSAPVGVADDYIVGFNLQRTILADGLLANDTDVDGSTDLMVRTTPVVDTSSGTLVLSADGGFSYTPNTNFLGTDTFTYEVCDNGLPNEIVSQFDFNTATLTDATVGPNATSINLNAVPIECGLHIPRGSTGGNVGLDLVIPNTGAIFNFTSFDMRFEYRDQESQASLIEGGNFRLYHVRANDLGVELTVINSTTGLSQTVTQDLGGFLSGNNPYSVTYDERTGNIIYDANGTVTTYNLAPPFSPLDVSLASDVTVGRQLDNAGRDFASFCSVVIVDQSVLCDTAVVTLTVRANLITNRRITYRIRPN
ncbi:Ig-like domain-containing protein [uncultured Croceitalea sp.]|uniref:Ig-like domain-containing protein n=1 Tax=uncultured Croceitalea sp. TaxID=1798908 RepID=UPI003306053B